MAELTPDAFGAPLELDPSSFSPPASEGYTAGDYLLGLKRGVQKLPGAVTGLIDIPVAAVTGERYADKAADALGEMTGFQPGKWAEENGKKFSPGAQKSMQDVNEAWKGSGADRLGNALLSNWEDIPEAWRGADLKSVGRALVEHPGYVANQVVESAPSMLAGGVAAKGLTAAKVIANPIIAGAAGEGAVAAGQNMDQTDRSADPRKAAAAAAAAGTIDALIAGAGGKLANRLGLEDLQTRMAGGKAADTGLGTPARVAGGMVSEGVLQELPQSMNEQIWQNVAEDKPLGEGVIRQGVEGMLAGMAMGGGANVMPSAKPAEAAPPATDAELDAGNAELAGAIAADEAMPGATPQLGYDPSASVITVPTQAGGTTTIDRNTGPLSAAVVDSGAADMLATGTLLQSYPSKFAAQAALNGRPDADQMEIQPHPSAAAKGRFAIVPKPAPVLDANQAALDRQAQLQAEEEANTKQIVALHKQASAIERSVSDGTSPEDAKAAKDQAKKLRAQAQKLATQAEDAQAELAPQPAQPVAEMPGVQAQSAEKAAQARASNEARATSLIDEEASAANPEPSDAQIEAGNYRKGHVKVGPLNIAIENPAGSTRRGKGWTVQMRDHYGYVKRTKGADGDQVDVYIKPGTDAGFNGTVYVVDQFDPTTGRFDEHKAMLGYRSHAEASAAYDAHFSDKSGPKRRAAVLAMPMETFARWAKAGDTSRPISRAANEQDAAQAEIEQSTGKFSKGRQSTETPEQYHARKAAEANAKRERRKASAEAKPETPAGDTLKRTLGEDAEVVSAKDLPNQSETAGNQLSRQVANTLELLAKLFKKQVVLFRAGENVDGFWIDGNQVFINVDNPRSGIAHINVLGHELTHAMKKEAPAAYQTMLDAVSSLLTEDEIRAAWQDYKGEPLEGEVTDAQRSFITEEWMSDLAGNRFSEAGFWESVYQAIEDANGSDVAKGIIAKLRLAIINAINKVLSVIRGQKFGVDARLADSLDQVRAAVTEGFTSYAKSARAGALKTAEPGETKFSKKPGSDVGHKRTSKGEYVGAPPGMTASRLGKLRNTLRTLIDEGKAGRMWYEESSHAILAAAEGDPALAEKISGLLAIYSPNATVSANATMGIKALYQWANGESIKVRFPVQDKKAQAWMDGTIAEDDAMQIKTGNFHRNLMRKIDETNYGYDKQGATIDMWMARVFGYGSKVVGSEARYYFAERETKQLAKELGWEPQQVQAALWVAIKARVEAIRNEARDIGAENGWLKKVEKNGSISWEPKNAEMREKYEALILKMALAADRTVTDEFIHKGVYNFATALKERVGQISWEAMPGKTTGVLPGIFDAPLEQQAEYLAAIDGALRDENGGDLIAKRLNLPVLQTAFGPSAWQMNVGAGAQTEVVIPTDRDQKNKGVSVNANARELLNAYAAIRGYVLAQEAVVWHYPVFTAAKKDANGVQLDFGRDPTHDEVVSLYNAINAVSGRDDWAPAYVPGVGVRILNFSEVANTEFHNLVKQAAQAEGVPDFHFKTFKAEGDYIGNDWNSAPKGEQYKEIINGQDSKRDARGSGRSDLQGWVESELRPRVERVNQEFADKYGWGKPKLSAGRYEQSGSRSVDPGPGRRGGTRVGQGGRVDLVGIHYSSAERQQLNGVFFGAGTKSEEAARILQAKDTRLKSRIYFYVNEGKGVRPEQGVGDHAHRADINNLYDLKGDPLQIRQKTRDANERESLILDAGFDGYYAEGVFGDQGVAILMGKAALQGVTPEYLGTGYRGGEPAAAPVREPVPVSPIAGRKDLPMGKMTGAEWKRLVPEAKVEDDQLYYKDDLKFSRGRRLAAEAEAERMVNEQGPALVQQYFKRFGKVIDPDNVKKLFPSFEADPSLAAAVHEASSRLAKMIYTEALSRNKGRPVIFLQQGSGELQGREQGQEPGRPGERARGEGPLLSLGRIGQAIDDTIRKVDAAVDGLSNLPNQFDYLNKRYLALGKIARVDEIVKEIRQAFSQTDPANKKAVYNYLTTRGASAAGIPDANVRSIAERIKKTINYVGDQLVARGLLDQQARDHYRDQYLPRMYLRHMLNDQDYKVLGMGKKPSDLGYLKHRKDIPPEIREVVLGEVKDPAFLSASAIGRAMRDVSLLDWMGQISQNNDWVFPEVFVPWQGKRVTAYWLRAEADRIENQAQHYDAPAKQKADALVTAMRQAATTALGNMSAIDHKKYKQIPDTMRYGLLRGMWVRNEVFDDIMGASQIVNADPTWFEDWFGFGGKGTKLTQWWKFTKVALNPPGQIRNFLSNMVMLQLSGIGLHKLPLRLVEAARDISNNGPYWRVAKKYGVTESTFTAQEMFRIKRDLIALEAQQGKLSSLRWLISAGAKFLDGVSNLYQFSEALGKTIKIMDEMKKGRSEAEAALEAQKWLFDYSLVPQSVRIARNAPVGMPFLTYQVKVLPRLMEVAAKHPWRFLPWAGLLYGMQAAVASMFGVDEDELKKLKKSLPQWLQDRSHTVFLPMRDADGRLQVADVGYFFPWTFYTQTGMHLGQGDLKKGLVDDIGGQFSAPIIGAAHALMTNYDSFTKQPVYREADPVGYQAASIANFAYDLMAPPFLSSHGFISPMGLVDKKFGGKMVQAETGTTNKFGDPKATEAQALAGLVGINFYGMDPDHTRLTNLQVMRAKTLEVEKQLRQRLMDRSLSAEDRGKIIADYRDRMQDLSAEMIQYAKDSTVPEQLRVKKQ